MTPSNKVTKKACNSPTFGALDVMKNSTNATLVLFFFFHEPPMRRRLLLPTLSILLIASACTSTVPAHHPSHLVRGIVVLETNVDAAAVIDGGAPTALRAGKPTAIPTPAGMHALEVTAEGYLPRRFDLKVNEGEQASIKIELWPLVEELDLD